jgi:hypothetical protein
MSAHIFNAREVSDYWQELQQTINRTLEIFRFGEQLSRYRRAWKWKTSSRLRTGSRQVLGLGWTEFQLQTAQRRRMEWELDHQQMKLLVDVCR